MSASAARWPPVSSKPRLARKRWRSCRGAVAAGGEHHRGVLPGPLPDLPQAQVLGEQFFQRQAALARVHAGTEQVQVSARRRAMHVAERLGQAGQRQRPRIAPWGSSSASAGSSRSSAWLVRSRRRNWVRPSTVGIDRPSVAHPVAPAGPGASTRYSGWTISGPSGPGRTSP